MHAHDSFLAMLKPWFGMEILCTRKTRVILKSPLYVFAEFQGRQREKEEVAFVDYAGRAKTVKALLYAYAVFMVTYHRILTEYVPAVTDGL